MKKIFYSFMVLACVIITACTSEDSLNPPEPTAVRNANKVTVQEALSRAEGYFNAFNKQTGTRSSVSGRKVKSIEAIRSQATTRSSGSDIPDTLYYIINYADDSGFAVMSADKRTVPLYAISEDGRFDLNDTLYNKGLALFVHGMENDILATPYKPGPVFPIDTTNNSGTELAPQIVEHVGPYLTETVRVWHQIAPQNKFCPEKNGEKCLVGCVAIGTAQAMTYYKSPSSYNGNIYDWEDINSHFNSECTAHLLADLGREENLDMGYGLSASGASPYYIDRTLFNMGYEHVGTSGTGFNITNAKQALKSGPIIVCGTGLDKDKHPTSHVWSMDEYLIYLDNFSINEEKSIPLFYCVWGWGGTSNGYYYWKDGFDLNHPETLTYPNDNYYNENHPVYTSGIRFWSNLKIRN